MVNQFSGINAINIYSSTILKNIPGMKVGVGVYLLAGANVVGSLLGPIVQKYVSIRKMIIVGEFLIAVFNIGVLVFQIANKPIMILVCMILMIIVYQCTQGSYYFVYAS